MALRLVDKLFTTTTLVHSTVNGTKEFAALDPSKTAAIKGISQLAFLKQQTGKAVRNYTVCMEI